MNIKKVNAAILKFIFRVPDLKVSPRDGNSSASVLPDSLRENLPILFARLDVHSILEIDLQGGSLIRSGFDLSNISYKSVGLIQALQNKAKINDVELVYVRNDICHYSDEEIISIISFTKSIGARYFLATTFPWVAAGKMPETNDSIQNKSNSDVSIIPPFKNFVKSIGKSILPSTHPWQDYSVFGLIRRDFRRINLQKPPFNLPVPEAFIIEGDRADGFQDRSLCLWQINAL